MKIAVLISGGVDSSVALRLLKEQGHDLRAFYLKIWLEDELSYLGECPWEEDLSYAQAVCDQAEVPLQVISLQKEYWDRVVSYTIAEAKAGRTPNPDIFCNQQVKFGAFYEFMEAGKLGKGQIFDKVATGHYAQLDLLPQGAQRVVLKMAPDPVKDQTYFLSQLSQEQLSKALFPIGHLKKAEVRALAEKYALPNRDRKDSQGICFLGKVPFREFLKHHLGEKPGDFVEKSSGKKVGEHLGYWFYTTGQRQGLGLSGGPWFVVGKAVEKNVIHLAHGYEPEEVYKKEFRVGDLHQINEQGSVLMDIFSEKPPPPSSAEPEAELFVKIRHGAALHACRIEKVEEKWTVHLEEPVHGVAPGQFAVFYVPERVLGLSGEGKVCLGGGMIQA